MQTEFIRIEPKLIKDVIKATGIHVKSKAVRRAIEEYLLEKKRKSLKDLAGKLEFYTQKDLEKMRRDA